MNIEFIEKCVKYTEVFRIKKFNGFCRVFIGSNRFEVYEDREMNEQASLLYLLLLQCAIEGVNKEMSDKISITQYCDGIVVSSIYVNKDYKAMSKESALKYVFSLLSFPEHFRLTL